MGWETRVLQQVDPPQLASANETTLRESPASPGPSLWLGAKVVAHRIVFAQARASPSPLRPYGREALSRWERENSPPLSEC